ncbi:MAG TPA: YihY/virulence factor BrkB family protein [Bryobacteraceae bacterium]|jgi:membrane protein|nr:YihY/virulence factor BrkB family protein [Bryobacteraceae bacterium]
MASTTDNNSPANSGLPLAATEEQRHKALTNFHWREIKPLIGASFSEWNRQNVPRLGASLAFYSLLSLAPLLLVTVSLVGLVLGHSAAQHGIIEQVRSLMGPAAAKAVGAFLQGSHSKSGGVIATIAGIITLLFSASGVLIELRDALNTIWEVRIPTVTGIGMVTSFVKQRLFSFAMVLAIGFLLIVSLVLSTWIAALGAVSASVGPIEDVLFHIANIVISFVVIAGVFAAIYKVLPEVHMEWRDAMTGGIVTSLLFTIGKFVLGVYLGRASYSSMYGAAASLVVLIAWIYYSAQIFFLGAEFTKTFAKTYGSHQHRRVRSKAAGA